jgi:HK97 family phage major capsid protein
MTAENLTELVTEMGDAFETFKKTYDDRLAAERKEREALEAKINRGGLRSLGNDAAGKSGLRKIGEAFRGFIKSGDKSGFAELESKGMMVGSDPDGGYAVIPEFSSSITASLKEMSPIRTLADVRQISTDALEEIYDVADATADWVGEVTARTETDTPDLGKWRIPANEIYAMPKASQQLLDDAAINIGEWLVSKVTTRFAQKEGSAFISGNGAGKPRGILSYATAATSDATRAWGVIQHVVTGVDGDFAVSAKGDKLIDLQAELKAGYRANAVWLMNRRTAAAVRKFKDGQSNYLWQPSTQANQPDMLLGHRIVLDEEMPDVGSGTYPIAFGDFKRGYTIVDRLGIRVLRDPYSAKPYVLFYCYARVGGDVTNFEAIKLLKCAVS